MWIMLRRVHVNDNAALQPAWPAGRNDPLDTTVCVGTTANATNSNETNPCKTCEKNETTWLTGAQRPTRRNGLRSTFGQRGATALETQRPAADPRSDRNETNPDETPKPTGRGGPLDTTACAGTTIQMRPVTQK